MLVAVPHGRRSLAAQTAKLSRCRARDDGIGFPRLSALECADALEYERTCFTGDSPDDPFEADERGRSVRAVHHQVFDVPVAFEIAGEGFRDGGSGQLREVRAFAVRLL